MHGVKRQRPGHRDPDDVARAKAAKERARIVEYTDLRAQLATRRNDDDFTTDALNLTTRVLEKNPEYPTGWGYRRRILLKGILPEKDESEAQRLLENDLDLTAQCLKRNPKDYSVWEHRKWVLRTMPDPDWYFELKTTEALLERDARNYHAWDYRRYIVTRLQCTCAPSYSTRKRPQPTTKSELAYTTNKISASFSNFSAWHHRSKLLGRLWREDGLAAGSQARTAQMDQEFELIKQALYTDPDDQSAWIYHRWLVGEGNEQLLRREIGVIEELAELEPESKWCLESLVHYGRQLARSLPEGAQERKDLLERCQERLVLLERVDSLRCHRYRDLGKTLV